MCIVYKIDTNCFSARHQWS